MSERHGLAAGTFSPPDRAISLWPGRRADWHMWIMDVSGDALFPRRYLDEYEKRVFELHRCVERAREHHADAMRQAAGFLLDAADAHEQAAMAYELAGGNGHARAFQARAMRHRQAAAARRAAAAALASGAPKGRVSDDPRPHAAIPDGDPPGLPGEPDAGTDHLGVSCGNGHEQQRDTRFYELPRDITYRAVGPAQAVLLLAVLLLAAPTRRRATERVPTPMAMPAGAAAARQGHPHRPGEDHHPAPIPARPGSSGTRPRDPEPDTEGDHRPGSHLR